MVGEARNGTCRRCCLALSTDLHHPRLKAGHPLLHPPNLRRLTITWFRNGCGEPSRVCADGRFPPDRRWGFRYGRARDQRPSGPGARSPPSPVAAAPGLTMFRIAVRHSGLPWPCAHREYGALYGVGPWPVQGLLEGLAGGVARGHGVGCAGCAHPRALGRGRRGDGAHAAERGEREAEQTNVIHFTSVSSAHDGAPLVLFLASARITRCPLTT